MIGLAWVGAIAVAFMFKAGWFAVVVTALFAYFVWKRTG